MLAIASCQQIGKHAPYVVLGLSLKHTADSSLEWLYGFVRCWHSLWPQAHMLQATLLLTINNPVLRPPAPRVPLQGPHYCASATAVHATRRCCIPAQSK